MVIVRTIALAMGNAETEFAIALEIGTDGTVANVSNLLYLSVLNQF